MPITDLTQVGDARRQAVKLVTSLDFDETLTSNTAIITTELASNLAKHSTGGKLLLDVLIQDGLKGIEIRSLDNGPGMHNVAECMRDGYSSTGSAGTGLGAVSRLANQFDIHSIPQIGTAILARLWAKSSARRSAFPPLEFGEVCIPLAEETSNGDGWAVWQGPGFSRVLVVDGLGHGVLAEPAAHKAIQSFLANPTLSLVRLVEVLHAELAHTRGASLAVAEIDYTAQVISYVGVGNIAGAIVSTEGRHGLISLSGTVGHTIRKVTAFTYPYTAGALLVMHSDGLTERWDITRYPGLLHRHPSLVAGRLFFDYARDTDDVIVWVARLPVG